MYTFEEVETKLKEKDFELALRLAQLIQLREHQNELYERIKKINPYLNKEGQVLLKEILKKEVNLHYFNTLEEELHILSYSEFLGIKDILKNCSKSERLICVFLALDYSIQEIANVLHKSKNAVNVSISRLRCKISDEEIEKIKSIIGYNCLDSVV